MLKCRAKLTSPWTQFDLTIISRMLKWAENPLLYGIIDQQLRQQWLVVHWTMAITSQMILFHHKAITWRIINPIMWQIHNFRSQSLSQISHFHRNHHIRRFLYDHQAGFTNWLTLFDLFWPWVCHKKTIKSNSKFSSTK